MKNSKAILTTKDKKRKADDIINNVSATIPIIYDIPHNVYNNIISTDEAGGNTDSPALDSEKMNEFLDNGQKSGKRIRAWAITLFREENNPPIFNPLLMRYLCYGSEICPKSKKHHFQSYIYFNNGKTFKQMKTFLFKWLGENPHFEICFSSDDNNIEYCKKDGKFSEFGKKPEQGKRNDLMELKDLIIEGKKSVDDITIDNPEAYHQYGRTLNRIEDIYLRSKYRTEATKGKWYFGSSGSGKSQRAFKDFDPKTHYVLNSSDNNYWEGYNGQDTVIIDGFTGEIPLSMILKLLDKYPMTVKRRGRDPVPFLSKNIIITSNLEPRDIYKDNPLISLYKKCEIINKDRENQNVYYIDSEEDY